MSKIQIAVLGGGCGAIAAAYELSASAELRAKYAVTVYQQGWRLGGKGASGRNAAYGNRIEEHGLHMWMGFYQNAFAMIRQVYAEWQKTPDNPFQDWSDAFTPEQQISLSQHRPDGVDGPEWAMWNIPLPPMPGVPGDGGHLTLGDFAQALAKWLADRHHAAGHGAAKSSAERVHGWLGEGMFERIGEEAAKVRQWLGGVEEDLERLVLMLEIGWALLKGLVEDVLPKGQAGLRSIDHLDFRNWIRGHGLSERAIWSAPIKALYDLGFAYEAGDNAKPAASAGVVTYAMLNIVLGARGAVLYRMNAGMGDTIFSPLYEVLAARGVQFEFFHRVEALHLSPDQNLIQSIDLTRQVDCPVPYQPLVPVTFGEGKVLPCWPSEPQWGQITDGALIAAKLADEQLTLENKWCSQSAGPRTLQLGREFDHVVLGISLAALKDICPELIAAHEPFAAMVNGIPTVQTQAMQLWLNRDTVGMGWTHGATVLTAYADPQSSWADMTHLLKAEPWPGEAPKSVAYFCGPLPDSATAQCLKMPSPPACATTYVGAQGAAWLDANGPTLWPLATSAGGFDWSVLHGSGEGPERLSSQYLRANIDPTERYVQCPPGTVHLRLKSGNSGFGNLVLAGDWTETRLNSGSVEGAVESGMRAARAISGYPQTIFGEGLEG